MLRKVHNLMKEAAAVGYFEASLKTLWYVYFFTTPLYFRKDFRWFIKMQTIDWIKFIWYMTNRR